MNKSFNTSQHKDTDKIVFPPGTFIDRYIDDDLNVSIYNENAQGGLYTQVNGYKKPITEISTDISVCNSNETKESIFDKYFGKKSVIEIWNLNDIYIKKYGFIEKVNDKYLLIKDYEKKETTFFDVKSIKYLSIRNE